MILACRWLWGRDLCAGDCEQAGWRAVLAAVVVVNVVAAVVVVVVVVVIVVAAAAMVMNVMFVVLCL